MKERKNTRAARKMAEIWQTETGEDFPGGTTNAHIENYYVGYVDDAQGAWRWQLFLLDQEPPAYGHLLPAMGSNHKITECLSNQGLIEWDRDSIK